MVENTLLELAARGKKRKMPRCSPMKNISRSRRSRFDCSSWRLQEGRKKTIPKEKPPYRILQAEHRGFVDSASVQSVREGQASGQRR